MDRRGEGEERDLRNTRIQQALLLELLFSTIISKVYYTIFTSHYRLGSSIDVMAWQLGDIPHIVFYMLASQSG